MLIVDAAAWVAYQMAGCRGDFSPESFDMSSLIELGLRIARISRLLQSRRFPACRSLQTQSAGDALLGNHLGLPFGKHLGGIRCYIGCISIDQMLSVISSV
jgi:hypothetical protein